MPQSLQNVNVLLQFNRTRVCFINARTDSIETKKVLIAIQENSWAIIRKTSKKNFFWELCFNAWAPASLLPDYWENIITYHKLCSSVHNQSKLRHSIEIWKSPWFLDHFWSSVNQPLHTRTWLIVFVHNSVRDNHLSFATLKLNISALFVRLL